MVDTLVTLDVDFAAGVKGLNLAVDIPADLVTVCALVLITFEGFGLVLPTDLVDGFLKIRDEPLDLISTVLCSLFAEIPP